MHEINYGGRAIHGTVGRLHEGDCSESRFPTSVLDTGEFDDYAFGKQLVGGTWLALNFIWLVVLRISQQRELCGWACCEDSEKTFF